MLISSPINQSSRQEFFDPLIAREVSIYLGAPNINEFAPGEHCFIHANDFKSPKELADYIEECSVLNS